jgi:hypothetical protein
MAKKTRKIVAHETPVVDAPVMQPEVAVHPILAVASTEVPAAKKAKVAPRTWSNADIITVLVPFAKGQDGASDSAVRYNRLVTGMSVGEYHKLFPKHANGDLRWNVQRAFISIAPAAEQATDQPATEQAE